jgi:hypothetical protein
MSNNTSTLPASKKGPKGRPSNLARFEAERAIMIEAGHDLNDPNLLTIICTKLKINPKSLSKMVNSNPSKTQVEPTCNSNERLVNNNRCGNPNQLNTEKVGTLSVNDI